MTETKKRARPSRPVIIIGGIVVVLIAMALSTTFVGKNAAPAASADGGLNPTAFAKDKYVSVIAPQIMKQATAVATVAAAIDEDSGAAAKKYGKQEGSNSPIFSVVATGTAGAANSDGLMPIVVAGMPRGVEVYVQMGPAINGTAIRDATGTVHYQQFVNQLDYQSASDQLNNQVKEHVLKALSATALKGKTVTVTGAFQLGNPAAYILTPVKVVSK